MEANKRVVLDADELAMVLNADKHMLKSMGAICFRRCILSFDREHLNASEQLCVDRCTSKFDQMVNYLTEHNSSLKV